MTATRGQHLNFLAILCCGWLAARTAMHLLDGAPPEDEERSRVAVTATKPPARPVVQPALAASHGKQPAASPGIGRRRAAISGSFGRIALRGQAAFAEQMTTGRRWPVPGLAPAGGVAAPMAFATPSPPPVTKGRRALTAETYAYSFWRNGGSTAGLAPRGQYGGGQNGFITTFALQSGPPRLALLVRAAIAHDAADDREVGLGVRWRPLRTLPVSITAERRIRNGRADAFAAYVAGGISDISLPHNFKLESFAQAGAVSGKDGGAFFDGFARADRSLLQKSALSLHAGGGIWAGGQQDAHRVDIGPSLRADVRIGSLPLRIGADWRFRIAGDARPGDGPALTLSTAF